MPATLTIVRDGKSTVVDLKDGVYRVGREKPADIVIPHSTVSGRHAELQISGDSFTLRDLGSTNGTFLNDQPLRDAKVIKQSDTIRFGAVEVRISSPATAAPAPQRPKVAAQATAKIDAAKTAGSNVRWNFKYWLAGASSILLLLVLFFFVQLYFSSAAATGRRTARFQALAAQYVHLMKGETVTAVPPPITDEWFQEPIMVANRSGRIIYPDLAAPDASSPLIHPKTKRVFVDAKNLQTPVKIRVPGPTVGSTIQAMSYPIASGGEILGYVIARPAETAESALGSTIPMLLISALIALVVLYFALKPITLRLQRHVELLRTKISPLANGFVDSLPRSKDLPEFDALASEIEKVVRQHAESGAAIAESQQRSGSPELRRRVPDLVDIAGLAYCFVDGDFKIVDANDVFQRVTEFSRAGLGTSLFEGGLTNIQSKQLVQAISDARRDGDAATVLELSRDGTPVPHNVAVRSFGDAGPRGQLYGIIFNASQTS